MRSLAFFGGLPMRFFGGLPSFLGFAFLEGRGAGSAAAFFAGRFAAGVALGFFFVVAMG